MVLLSPNMEGHMSIIYGDGLYLWTQKACGDGRVIYSLGFHAGQQFDFPGPRQLKRLGRKFLGGELKEDVGLARDGQRLFFSIASGTSAEDRAAFLGAVRHHCKQL
jgi:hypothetical protein